MAGNNFENGLNKSLDSIRLDRICKNLGILSEGLIGKFIPKKRPGKPTFRNSGLKGINLPE